jgi:hypothetical protein
MTLASTPQNCTRLFICVISGTSPLESTVTLPPFQSEPAGNVSVTAAVFGSSGM